MAAVMGLLKCVAMVLTAELLAFSITVLKALAWRWIRRALRVEKIR